MEDKMKNVWSDTTPDRVKKKERSIISGLFLAAALLFFVPLISIDTGFVSGAFSMKQLIDLVNKGSMAGEMLGYDGADTLGKMGIMLYVPYVLSLLAALANWFKPRRASRLMGIVVSILDIVLFVGAVMLGQSKLENLLGFDLSGYGVSVWKVLGIGYWLFILLHMAAILFCNLGLEEGEAEIATKEDTDKKNIPAVSFGVLWGISGEYAGVQIPVKEGESIVIGRDAGKCNLVVTGAKVSRRHCKISYFPETNRYVLTDFSSNGTFFSDGRQIQPNTTVEVMSGTSIYLGDRDNGFLIG